MESTSSFDILYLFALIIGFVVGLIAAWLNFKDWVKPSQLLLDYVPKDKERDWENQKEQLQKLLEQSKMELRSMYTQSDNDQALFENLKVKYDKLKQSHNDLTEDWQLLDKEQHALRIKLQVTEEKISEQKAEFNRLNEESKKEFRNISNLMLQQSGEKLREEHERSLRHLLNPMKERLLEFQQQVDQKFSDESKGMASLKTEIEHLTKLNQNLSKEAQQLTQALKGDSKSQGDWGEMQLETLLEASGLSAGTHFDAQSSYKNEVGQIQRPDFIIKLPQKRNLIIDSKVSLKAFEQFCSSEDKNEQQAHLNAHVMSIRNHIKGLAGKRYHELYSIKCPDYVMLFVPLEPAFITAVRHRPSLFTEALEQNVVLVSPSTLLATMRTVAYLWQQEDQRENTQKIAEVGKKLYEKFVNFVEDMDNVGMQLDKAKESYDKAMDKLSKSPKKATTLLARAQELKQLGISSQKQLPDA